MKFLGIFKIFYEVSKNSFSPIKIDFEFLGKNVKIVLPVNFDTRFSNIILSFLARNSNFNSNLNSTLTIYSKFPRILKNSQKFLRGNISRIYYLFP